MVWIKIISPESISLPPSLPPFPKRRGTESENRLVSEKLPRPAPPRSYPPTHTCIYRRSMLHCHKCARRTDVPPDAGFFSVVKLSTDDFALS